MTKIGIWLLSSVERIDNCRIIEASLQNLNLKISKFDAYFPQLVDKEEIVDFNNFNRSIIKKYHREAKPGEYGCALGHQNMVQHFLNSSFEYGIFLEDDVGIDDSGLRKLGALINELQCSTYKSLFVILGAQQGIVSMKPLIQYRIPFEKPAALNRVLFPSRLSRTAAYLFTKDIAREYMWKNFEDYDVADNWNHLVKNIEVKPKFINIFQHPISNTSLIR